MSAVETNLNFDDLIEAVKESSRGRWFLQEYESRLRKAETSNILAAITKLENALGSMNTPSADAALVARAKTAIATARKDIAAMDQASAGLSEEARLFSKLADMAKSAFAETGKAPTLVNHGIARTLKLVDELEQDFGITSATAAGPIPDIKKVDFFNQDAAVFEAKPTTSEPPAVASRAPSPAASLSAVKEVARGAKLTIRRMETAQVFEAPQLPPPQVLQEAPSEAAAVATPTEAPPVSAPAEKPSRVVIVRKKPEELMQVPMVSPDMESSAA